ncbi:MULTISPECIES: UDP-N-acetylmuramate dehydrogenase [unclassified Vibrio]|uniref:UDP-N-acetylmuramate dehydrogenase n=1 Tax=unclassified Vibrio TaxID=2614977 RepID=UPI003551BD16
MKIENNIPLSNYSNWKIGGVAHSLIQVDAISDYVSALEYCTRNYLKPVIIGNTTNVLFNDGFLNIALIKLGEAFSTIDYNGENLVVGANVYCPYLAKKAKDFSLTGFEHIVGIPATLGGLICMNGGSQRKTISSLVKSVTSIDKSGKLIVRNINECQFDYRESTFQNKSELILSVELECNLGNKRKILSECLSILRERSRKFPRKKPSCGSVFISHPEMYFKFGPPGKVIEDLGLKGVIVGGAQISPEHANFIVNNGGSSAADVLALVRLINDNLENKGMPKLRSEALFISNGIPNLRLDEFVSNEKK